MVRTMQITEIQDLIAVLCELHGKDWSAIARGVQAENYYTDMDVRSLADKIRKSRSRGALRHINIKDSAFPPDDDEDFEAVTVNSVASRERTKLVALEHVVNMTADKILEIAGFSPSEWRLTACKFKYWNVFCKMRTGKREVNELFAASVTAAPKEPKKSAGT